jgi:hypothetical protein
MRKDDYERCAGFTGKSNDGGDTAVKHLGSDTLMDQLEVVKL